MNSIDFQADHERLKWLAGCGTNDGPIRIGSVNLADAMELSLPAWNNVCGIRLSMMTNLKTDGIYEDVGGVQ